MNNKTKTISEMLNRLDNFKTQNNDLLSQHSLFSKTYIKLDELRKQLSKGLKDIENKKNTITREKWEKKENLAAILSIVLGNLAHYSLKKDQNLLTNQLYSSEKRLVHTQSDNLTFLADKALEMCKKLGPSLPETGITEDLFKLLDTTLFQYIEILEMHRERQNKRNASNRNLEKHARKVLEILDTALDPIIQNTLKLEHPDLLSQYHKLRKMPTYAHRKTAIKGRLLNSQTNSPITNVWIEIPKAKISYRIKSAQGGFHIRHLPPGQYSIIFKHKDFETTSLDFTHRWGETSYLEIRMNPVTTANFNPAKKDEPIMV